MFASCHKPAPMTFSTKTNQPTILEIDLCPVLGRKTIAASILYALVSIYTNMCEQITTNYLAHKYTDIHVYIYVYRLAH